MVCRSLGRAVGGQARPRRGVTRVDASRPAITPVSYSRSFAARELPAPRTVLAPYLSAPREVHGKSPFRSAAGRDSAVKTGLKPCSAVLYRLG